MRQNQANADLRKAIRRHGLFNWQIAKRCGIGETTLCVWLREELPADDPRRMAILQALEGGGDNGTTEKEMDSASL